MLDLIYASAMSNLAPIEITFCLLSVKPYWAPMLIPALWSGIKKIIWKIAARDFKHQPLRPMTVHFSYRNLSFIFVRYLLGNGSKFSHLTGRVTYTVWPTDMAPVSAYWMYIKTATYRSNSFSCGFIETLPCGVLIADQFFSHTQCRGAVHSFWLFY